MGSLGLTATAMAVRSAFALLCFALLCGLAASSGFQSETETELTKNKGEAAGNQILVAEAVESSVARGSKRKGKKNACKEDPKSKECLRKKNRRNKTGKKQKNDKPKKIKGKKSKKNRNKTRRNNN